MYQVNIALVLGISIGEPDKPDIVLCFKIALLKFGGYRHLVFGEFGRFYLCQVVLAGDIIFNPLQCRIISNDFQEVGRCCLKPRYLLVMLVSGNEVSHIDFLPRVVHRGYQFLLEVECVVAH